ncbi:MAG TPA: MarR family transcriptional regulator [Vicinamibacteria bacterium]|nr:MarR family transcriptional regulator [Vicinamibacteria bacterium]
MAVADRLHSAAIHLLRRLRREDATSGIGSARLSALSVLVFGGPVSLGRLAAAEQVRPPTMSRIVAGLERAGLAARAGDPRDGRQVVLQATRAGARVLHRGRRRRIAALAARLRPLAPRQLGTLAEAAELIERVLRRREPSRHRGAVAHTGR